MKKALWNGMFSGAFFVVLILVVWEREILRFQSDCAGRNRMLFVHEQNSVWQIYLCFLQLHSEKENKLYS